MITADKTIMITTKQKNDKKRYKTLFLIIYFKNKIHSIYLKDFHGKGPLMKV